MPTVVKKWKSALAKAKLTQVGVSSREGLLTFSGVEPGAVTKLGAALAQG